MVKIKLWHLTYLIIRRARCFAVSQIGQSSKQHQLLVSVIQIINTYLVQLVIKFRK
jgi:hypothetical protein